MKLKNRNFAKSLRRYSVIFLAISTGLLSSGTSLSQSLSNSSDYSAGLSAYINGDYEVAKQHWLLAAQNNDGKAMFNLGLMHERQLLLASDYQRAEQWFRQAGNAGYAPADYHLALLAQSRGQISQANRLLRRAAESGFILAQERLGLDATLDKSQDTGLGTQADSKTVAQSSKPTATPNAAAITNATATTKQAANIQVSADASSASAKNIYNRESWLLQQSPDAWTIQMLAFSDEAKVRNFIDDHGLHKNAAYFAQASGSNIVYKLVYGAYSSKALADTARSKFTASLKEHGPWLRPLKGVQKVIEQR